MALGIVSFCNLVLGLHMGVQPTLSSVQYQITVGARLAPDEMQEQ